MKRKDDSYKPQTHKWFKNKTKFPIRTLRWYGDVTTWAKMLKYLRTNGSEEMIFILYSDICDEHPHQFHFRSSMERLAWASGFEKANRMHDYQFARGFETCYDILKSIGCGSK